MSEAYQRAGVNIEAGYEAVQRIKAHAARTRRPEVLDGIGAFGTAFDLSRTGMNKPVLVTGTDGVGTKLMVAQAMDDHTTIGIDAVAMCVNDIVTQGAEPLFFLDYIACGKLEPNTIEQIVKGIADGCERAGCALIGGETAEMPGMYPPDEYDIAGFAVGAVEKTKRITGKAIEAGDALIGLASDGLHSNGFSLVRKIVREAGIRYDEPFPPTGRMLGAELLRPTRLYVRPLLALMRDCEIRGMAHITGGGLYENVPRMLPKGLGALVDARTWPIPAIFSFLREKGGLTANDLYATFNMGIGMVIAVRAEDADAAVRHLIEHGEKAYRIGEVITGGGLRIEGTGL